MTLSDRVKQHETAITSGYEGFEWRCTCGKVSKPFRWHRNAFKGARKHEKRMNRD